MCGEERRRDLSRPPKIFSLRGFLICVFFIAPTVQYRTNLGSLSFSFMEPVAVLVSSLLLAHQMLRWHRLVILRHPLVPLLGAIVLWTVLARPWDPSWRHALSDVRDWSIPFLSCVVFLTTIRQGWRRWMVLFVAVVWFNALLGLYQHLADGFRPFIAASAAYKTGFQLSPEDSQLALTPFAVGLFSHPNAFAIYLYLGLMIALGKVHDSKPRTRSLLIVAVVLPMALALVWTYSKASLLVTAGAVIFFWLMRRIESDKVLVTIMIVALLAVGWTFWNLLPYLPATLLGTLWWRVGLWGEAIVTIRGDPNILLVGNGLERFDQLAYYAQPHNLYLYLLLQYGLVGVVWVFAVAAYIWRKGMSLRREGVMKDQALLAGTWVGLLGYFVIGLVESNLMSVESRLTFMTVAACFAGLASEIGSAHQNVDAPEETGEALGERNAAPRSGSF